MTVIRTPLPYGRGGACVCSGFAAKCVPEYLQLSVRDIKNPNSISKNALQLLEVLSKYPQQQNKLYDNLYAQLSAGELVAIGYEMPIKSSDHPIFIPRHLWPPEKCHAGKSEITAHGLHFVRVRIISKANLPIQIAPEISQIALPENKKPPLPKFEIEIKKKGPQSNEAIVFEA